MTGVQTCALPISEPTFDAINKRWFIDLGSFKYGRVGLLDLDTLEPSVVAV